MLELQRRDPDLLRIELFEDLLRLVRAVVVPDARVIASDDEVSAAVVAPHDRVENGLARPRVAHRCRKHGEQYAIRGVVALQQDLVAADADVGRNVVGLRLAHDRVNQQPVGHLERALGQVFVGAVDRVSRLKRDDGIPASLLEDCARALGIEVVLRKLGLRQLDHRDRSTHPHLALGVERGDSGVHLVVGLEDRARLLVAVHGVAVAHLEQRERLTAPSDQRDLLALLQPVGELALRAEGDGDRPGHAARQVHVRRHALALRLGHEAAQRAEAAVGEKLEVRLLARAQRDLPQARRLLAQAGPLLLRSAQVYEVSTSVGGDGHALSFYCIPVCGPDLTRPEGCSVRCA